MSHDPSDPGELRPLESTAELLRRIHAGDDSARNRLLERYTPILKRWAHGRLPAAARSLAETDDMVQETVMSAFQKLDSFEQRHEGAFFAYLRRILQNRVNDECRRFRRTPQTTELPADLAGATPTPLESTVSAEALNRYEAALRQLPERTREAVVLRIEFGFSFPQIAEAIDSPSANAARMLVSRALSQVARTMKGPPGGSPVASG